MISSIRRRFSLSILYGLIAVLSAQFAGAPASSQEGYRLSPGDVLRVEVLEDESLNRTVLVAPDGRISFPLAGDVRAGGRTLAALRTDLITKLSPNFSNAPTVFVSLERLAPPSLEEPELSLEPITIAIYVLGETGNSGRIDLEPGTTLLQAFSQMGGFSDFAAVKRVQLRRRDPLTGLETIYPLNYRSIVNGQSPNGSVLMQDGDVILVPTRRLFE